MDSKAHCIGLLADVRLRCFDSGTGTCLDNQRALRTWLLRCTSALADFLDSCADTAAPGNGEIICAARSLLRFAGARTKQQAFERSSDYSVDWPRSETAVGGDCSEWRSGTEIPGKSATRP